MADGEGKDKANNQRNLVLHSEDEVSCVSLLWRIITEG